MPVVLLIIGFVLLGKGADILVKGAVSLSEHFRIPSLVIGLTVVAFGTSAPEAAVGIRAAIDGAGEIVLGNVVGSNIMNILVILGICAIITPLKVSLQTIVKETPFVLLASVVLLILTADRTMGVGPDYLGRSDALILLAFFVIYIYAMLEVMFMAQEKDLGQTNPEYTTTRSVILLVAGLVGIFSGATLAVSGAQSVALALGMSETWVGLTVVAFGTSLPEIVTSVTAVRQGQTDLAIGNALGSNAFNLLLVLPLSGLIRPLSLSPVALTDVLVMVATMILLMFFMWTGRVISRREGIGMLLAYAIYFVYLTMR